MASCENLSFPYLNSINWIMKFGSMVVEGRAVYGRPLMQRMYGLRRALQWHFRVRHVHGRSHDGIVFSCGLLLKISAFIPMKQRKILEVIINLQISQTASLCLFTINP